MSNLHYSPPQDIDYMAVPAADIADQLLAVLLLSNGLEFIPIPLRLALIQELSKPESYYMD